MSRFRAAGIHFLLSILIVLTVLALMLGLWYPGAYFKLMGGGNLVFIMAAVDVTLGPLLTLIVFKSGKKTLKFDLSVIVLLQLSALVYGSHVMFEARPVFNAFTGKQFAVVSAADIDQADLVKAKDEAWRKFPLTGPIVVATEEPTEDRDKEYLVVGELFGIGKQHNPGLYIPYASAKNAVLEAAQSLEGLSQDKQSQAVVEGFLKDQGKPAGDFVYLPVVSQFHKMTAVLNKQDAQLVAILDVNPYVRQ